MWTHFDKHETIRMGGSIKTHGLKWQVKVTKESIVSMLNHSSQTSYIVNAQVHWEVLDWIITIKRDSFDFLKAIYHGC